MKPLSIFCFLCVICNVSLTHAFINKNVPLMAECTDIAISDHRSMGYISGSDCGCIILIDFSQELLLADKQITISGSSPKIIKINHFLDELYVVDDQKNQLHLLSLPQVDQYIKDPEITPQVTSITVGKAPQNLAISPDGMILFVCSDHYATEEITVIDATSKNVMDHIFFDQDVDPVDMVVANNKLYVIESIMGIYVIDLSSYKELKRIPLDESAYNAISRPDEAFVYISHASAEGEITIIETSTDTIAKEISMGGIPGSIYKRTNGMDINNHILYAINNGDQSIALINTLTHHLITCPFQLQSSLQDPEQFVVSSDGNHLYMVHPGYEKLTVADIPSLCPVLKKNLILEFPSDRGIVNPILIVESEMCENLPLNMNVFVNKPGLFKTNPYVSQKGYLTFETNPTRIGNAVIDINISDITEQCFSESSIRITLTGNGLTLKKTGFGKFEIDDGYDDTCLPCTKCISPCQVLPDSFNFPKESNVTITAIPGEDEKGHEYYFKKWQGAYNGTDNPVTVKLNKPETILEAIFVTDYTPTGYAIIIQGKNTLEEGLAAHRNTTEYVYETFKKCGFHDNQIKYLKYDHEDIPEKDPENEPTKDRVKYAIKYWADDRLKEHNADLYIVFVGHGSEDQIDFGTESISSLELKEWLDVLNTNANIIVMIGSCHSGSFIDDLSAPDRIIITSSRLHENSNKGKSFADDIIQEGDYFIYHFFYAVSKGENLRDSFNEASLATSRYFDKQHPLLDDNHDYTGTFDLLGMLNGEGEVSRHITVGEKDRNIDDIRFLKLPPDEVDSASLTTSFVLDLGVTERFDNQFWIDILPETTLQNVKRQKLMPRFLIESTPATSKAEWKGITHINKPGTYKVLFFVKERNKDHVLLVREQMVRKNKISNQAPGKFSLLGLNQEIIPVYTPPEYTFSLDWTDAIDPDRDKLTYTLFISDNEQFSNAKMVSGLSRSLSIIQLKGPHEFEESCYYKVQAIDQYGATSESGTKRVNIKNPNDGQQGWIKGRVIDYQTKKLIPHANVFQDIEYSTDQLHVSMDGIGKFIGYGPFGNYDIQAEANGYYSTAKQSFSISSIWANHEIVLELYPHIALEILILQYLANMVDKVELQPFFEAIDIANDGIIGLGEAVDVLRQMLKPGNEANFYK